MSDFDPVLMDVRASQTFWEVSDGVHSSMVPQIVANELRRIYDEHGDPSLYFLVIRAQEIETL